MNFRLTSLASILTLVWLYSYVGLVNAQDSNASENKTSESNVFCYSGGLRNDYSCEQADSENSSFYAFQLLLDDTVAALTPSLTDTIFYQTALPDGRRFVYFGQYSDLDDAISAAESWRAFLIRHKETMRPMIVEFSHAEPLPRIRLAQTLFDEPEDYETTAAVTTEENSSADKDLAANDTITDAVAASASPSQKPVKISPIVSDAVTDTVVLEALAESIIESTESDSVAPESVVANINSDSAKADVVTEPKPQKQNNNAVAKNNNHHYDILHTVQLASFKGPNDRQDFYRRYPNTDLYCRQNSRGLYTVSLGVFNTYAAAKKQLASAEQFSGLGAYVVTMRDVVMAPCR